MATNVFDKSSGSTVKEIDISLMVEKPYLITDYIESNTNDNDTISQFRIKTSPDPSSMREPALKLYVDKLNDPSILEKTLHMLTSMTKLKITFVFFK